jgi:hypothetical protein
MARRRHEGVRSLIADILLSSIEWQRDALGLSLAERAAAFHTGGTSLGFVGPANLDHGFGKQGRKSGGMLGGECEDRQERRGEFHDERMSASAEKRAKE